ncbi:hypothetical protein B0J13DRAFT_10287 [Dactylonectria estremocensis]|uniref:Polyprenal reductase n=1 Tax=Dactylonectria estremocensis TaxID=1079267 RepID=A0A9P9JDG0_9HYPO|nr:hypothetical protein B0J13DRAFT_10287 [Dactylonectria estremocensis]
MDSLDAMVQLALGLTPAQWCRTFFLLSSGAVVVIQALPGHVRGAVMNYGARRPQDSERRPVEPAGPAGPLGGLWGLVTSLANLGQVPHAWFLHFYVLSVSCSAFWAWQYLQRGSLMNEMAKLQDRAGTPSMELGQVYAAWLMMALQGSRRLYESLYVSKRGSSPMWIVHWALGLVYYTSMGISVWVEGSSAILQSWESPYQGSLLTRKMPLALALYSVACLKQNECHRHLASLKKYTLPNEGWFRFLICPHYTCECILYLAIAWVAAPPGQLFNKTVLLGLLFVAVNLGSTAAGTKKWCVQKFGAEKVAGRWIMIPFVF